MKFSTAKKLIFRALPYVVLALVVLFFFCGGDVLDLLEQRLERQRASIGGRLANRHGVIFLADFDESVPVDAVSGTPLVYWKIPRVEGKFGDARRIDLSAKSVLQFPQRLHSCSATNFSCAAWFRPSDLNREQTLFIENIGSSRFRLCLSNKKLLLSVASAETNHLSECEFVGSTSEFTHVAVVFDESGISLWQNGDKSGTVPFAERGSFSYRVNSYGSDVHDPFEGEIDDLAVWDRALSAREVKAIARSSCGLVGKYESWLSFSADVTASAIDFSSGVFRAFGRLAPSFGKPAQIDNDIPKITFWTKKDDDRRFLSAHEKSIHSGYRTDKAATFRPVSVSIGGQTVKCNVALDDVYGRSDGKRMSFIVQDPSQQAIGGCGFMRLYPPELHSAFHPDAPYPLPISGTVVRFFINDAFKGLYIVEPFAYDGSAWMARGKRDPAFPSALYYRSLPSLCDIPRENSDPDAVFASVASMALSDVLFPWSRQEIYARQKAHGRSRVQNDFELVPEFDKQLHDVIGDNVSPMYVTTNLVFNKPGVTWESSDPSLVDQDGRVFRPASGAPRPVMLTPVASDGTRGEPRRIRVVPEAADLPTMFLYFGFPIDKHRRSDFVCYRIPAGGGTPSWHFGFAGYGGGIRHRGNTSYMKGLKRSFSVEFDDEVDFPGTSRVARHLLLYCGYADPTRLRNKVSFDAFRKAVSDSVPSGVVDISWTEVFINGEYFGVWETSRRVNDICDPDTLLYKVRAGTANLWSEKSKDMVDCVSDFDPRSNPYDDFEDLISFTSKSSRKTFVEQFESRFYTESLVDFFLMVNFTENFDGQFTNQYVARRKGDVKWFVVPWDYDKTFFNDERDGLSNLLLNRMAAQLPGFKRRLAEKWTALRSEEMSDEAVLGRIEADAAMLEPYMLEEYRLLKPLGWDGTFREAVELLKKSVSFRLKLMDRKMAPNQVH